MVAHVAPSGRRAKRAGGGESGGHLHQGRSGVPVGTDGGRGAKALREAAKKTGASWQDHVGNPRNTLYAVKRLIGRKFEEKEVQKD
ncbi:Hsp70 family protein, partial [Ralstonia pseudosolanacearum]|uniref:Hsp70 family protein n=1 Tax=Ralstonia pseudosolanacearum TaxID=1310165 RepID=UPI003CF8DA3F